MFSGLEVSRVIDEEKLSEQMEFGVNLFMYGVPQNYQFNQY